MRRLLQALLALQVAVILGFWYWNHAHHPMGNQLTGGSIGQLLAYGRLAGLLAALGTLVQLLLIGRIGWIERAFGFDRLSRVHHFVGFALVVFLVAHPMLVTLGHAAQFEVSPREQMIDFIKNWEDVAAAYVALAIMIVALVFSVVVVLKRMRYEAWYATHLTFYIALALAFGHQLEVGSDLTGNKWFRWYWIALYAFVGLNFIGYRFVLPLVSFVRHKFTVTRLEREPGDVMSVYIEGRNLSRFRIRAGQFFIVRFLAKGFRWEEHPFSMSKWPDGNSIRLSIKALGDYTRRIPQLQPGTRVLIDGPHGIFNADRAHSNKILLIAGGIGITPIRSVAEELVRRGGRDIVLIYGSRRRGEVVFESELAGLEQQSGGHFRVVTVMSDDPDWPGEKGRVDRDRIKRIVPDLLERDIYLCGPPPMMKTIRRSLVELDVKPDRVFFERFSL